MSQQKAVPIKNHPVSPPAWTELGLIIRNLKDTSKLSKCELTLLNFLRDEDFTKEFAEILKANFKELWINLLQIATEQMKEAQKNV